MVAFPFHDNSMLFEELSCLQTKTGVMTYEAISMSLASSKHVFGLLIFPVVTTYRLLQQEKLADQKLVCWRPSSWR